MFNRGTTKAKTSDSVSSINSRPTVKKPPAGRERLVHFDSEIKTAQTVISELETKIERLNEIVASADAHHRALQAHIEQDNGRSLSDYSEGKVEADSSIARLVLLADNSKRASTAASAALPTAMAQLENARSQLLDLGEQRAAELNRVLTSLGDLEADEYRKTFEKLGMLHDKLVGFSNVSQMSLGDIQLTTAPMSAPRFQFPSMRASVDADPYLRHSPSSLTVMQSAQKWTEIRSRLSENALADVNDLLIN
jgi:hypothetical protein